MSAHTELDPVKSVLEMLETSEIDLSYEITAENIEEDQDFIYLEIESPEDSWEQFYELGNYLNARSTSQVVGRDRYLMSVSKSDL